MNKVKMVLLALAALAILTSIAAAEETRMEIVIEGKDNNLQSPIEVTSSSGIITQSGPWVGGFSVILQITDEPSRIEFNPPKKIGISKGDEILLSDVEVRSMVLKYTNGVLRITVISATGAMSEIVVPNAKDPSVKIKRMPGFEAIGLLALLVTLAVCLRRRKV